MPTAPRIGTVMAERRLASGDGGGQVRVAVGVPRRHRNGVDWVCPFRIHGAGISRLEYGLGVDSMQALTTALDGIRALLDESGLALGLDLGDGEVWTGETGFARSVPIGFGPVFARRVGRLMDRELERHLRSLRSAPGRRRRKAAKSR